MEVTISLPLTIFMSFPTTAPISAAAIKANTSTNTAPFPPVIFMFKTKIKDACVSIVPNTTAKFNPIPAVIGRIKARTRITFRINRSATCSVRNVRLIPDKKKQMILHMINVDGTTISSFHFNFFKIPSSFLASKTHIE